METVDIAIIAVLQEEWDAILGTLPTHWKPESTQADPRLYSWRRSRIPIAGDLAYEVVLARLPHAGQIMSALATQATLNRWQPKYLFFVGIAGGFAAQGAKLGDIVLSDSIWGYEYGKIDVDRQFHPRPDLTYRCDSALLTAATDYWGHERGTREPSTNLLVGPVASGDKVVDEPESDFFASVMKAWPKLVAIEMEGAAAGASAAEAHSRGLAARFLMVRGVSDVPDAADGVESGTAVRDGWKPAAAKAAAEFVVGFIRSGLPTPPGQSNRGAGKALFTPLVAAAERAADYLARVQNVDGGIPATRPGQGSGCWTTASTLESLLALGRDQNKHMEVLDRLAYFLVGEQLENGSWPLVKGTEASTMATGHAIAALLDYRSTRPRSVFSRQVDEAVDRGFDWLTSSRRPGGGWGVEPGGTGDGPQFRIAPTYYGLRPFLKEGRMAKSDQLVSEVAHLIYSLPKKDGGWPFVSELNSAEVPCPSNSSRAVQILIESGLSAPGEPVITAATGAIMRYREGPSWRLSMEGFFEPGSHAQNMYHNNTPCDAVIALRLANEEPKAVLEGLEWLVSTQREDGAWALQSPNPQDRFYAAETWSTAEFIWTLVGKSTVD